MKVKSCKDVLANCEELSRVFRSDIFRETDYVFSLQ